MRKEKLYTGCLLLMALITRRKPGSPLGYKTRRAIYKLLLLFIRSGTTVIRHRLRLG
jgi:hypothetical protein